MKNKRKKLIIILIILIILLISVIATYNIIKNQKTIIKSNKLWTIEKIEIYDKEGYTTIDDIKLSITKSENNIKICTENNKCNNINYQESDAKIYIDYDANSTFGGYEYIVKYENKKLVLHKQAKTKEEKDVLYYFE